MLSLRLMRLNNLANNFALASLGNARHMSRRSTKGTKSVAKQQPHTVVSPPPQAHPKPPGFWRTVMQDATSYAIGTAMGRVMYNGISALFGLPRYGSRNVENHEDSLKKDSTDNKENEEDTENKDETQTEDQPQEETGDEDDDGSSPDQ